MSLANQKYCNDGFYLVRISMHLFVGTIDTLHLFVGTIDKFAKDNYARKATLMRLDG